MAFYSEDGDYTFLRNVGNHIEDYKHHSLEDYNQNFRRHENLKSHNQITGSDSSSTLC
jgi:ATPase subunit of ABC transporter with duplicated ATPase domains